MTVPLAAATAGDRLATLVAHLGGFAILAGTLAAVVAFLYRWYVREPVAQGLALLVGLGGVAAYLNTTEILGEIIGGSDGVTQTALFNISAFVAGLAGAALGRRLGDGFGTEVFGATGLGEARDGVSRLVEAVGRVLTVELPDDIEDVVGYDPVPASTKATLAGRAFVFPRRLTVDELRERLVARLQTDYAVGHVDVELAADGTVEHLALGSRAAGIGPTLPPATNAVAIRADPAFAASAGDLVQVWETEPLNRVLTAELRGVAGDVVTLAIDAGDTPKLDPDTRYRLVTLPVEDRPDREFASLLRGADETFSSVTVAAGSPLAGLAVGALDVTVVSVTADEGEATVLPGPEYVLGADDGIHAIARPEALRRLEAASEPVEVGPPTGGGEGVLADDPGESRAERASGETVTGERAGGGGPRPPTDDDGAGSPTNGSDGVESTPDGAESPGGEATDRDPGDGRRDE